MALEELQNGRYRRLRLLGTGGMGEVYLMEDMRVNRQVAIKVTRSEGTIFSDDEQTRDITRLFQREAKAIAALEHPNILPLYDFGEEVHDDTTITYMVMPYCADGSLAAWLKQRTKTARLSPRIIAHFVNQAADALQYAHDQEVVHLDVKPSNFLLRSNKRNPNRPTLLLADFGLARSFTTVSSSSHTIRGTPTSMAPEQWSGSPVAATDQYALAVMTYEMLAGRPPFVGSMEQLMYRHFTVEAAPPSTFNPKLPVAIDSVLLKALMKKPEERFPSITAFANAFEEAVRELSTNAIATVRPASASAPQKAASDNQTEAIEEPGLNQRVAVGEDQPTPSLKPENEVISVSDRQEPSAPAALMILADASARSPETPRLPGKEISAPGQSSVPSKAQQRSEPAYEQHRFPTVSSTFPGVQSLEQSPARREAPPRRIMSIILSAALIILLASGAAYYLSNHQRSNSQTNADLLNQAKTATAQAKVTSTPTPILTPPPGLYIPGTYNGTMQNQTTGQQMRLSVHIIQNNGEGTLKGSVTINSIVYALSGKIDMQGNFSFSAQPPSGQVPLYFFGSVYQLSDGMYLRGNYCNSSTNSCSANTGFFNIGPRYQT